MTARTARTVGLLTVGCKLNQYETEGLAEILEASGYAVVPFDEAADVYVVNTCTVTSRSDYRSRQMLRRAARANPNALVVAAGCYAQRDPNALGDMPEVGLVVGQSSKSQIPALIERALDARASMDGEGTDGAAAATGATLIDVRPHSREDFQSFDIEQFRGYTRAFLKIQDGCDRACSYCAVPSARGPARSRPLEEIVRHAARLSSRGYREIVLTGVHIGAYGDGTGGPRLPELLESLTGLATLARIRLGSVEPRELTAELRGAIVASGKVAHHLHVPMQSGADRVLEAMRRGYSRSEYAGAVRATHELDPLFGIGADVIVGFPGESDEDFADTVSLVEELPITYLHVFSFSPRPGTPAAEMDGQVPGTEKRTRSRTLRELGRRKSLAFRTGLIGTVQDVLVEEGSVRGGRRPSGLSGNYVRVEVEQGRELCNHLVRVVVAGADDTATWGRLEPPAGAPALAPGRVRRSRDRDPSEEAPSA